MKLSEHPTVIDYQNSKSAGPLPDNPIQTDRLKYIAIESGADDAGVIDLSRECVTEHREDLLNVLPGTESLLIIATQVNQMPLRSLSHSVADLEFKHANDKIKTTLSRITRKLKEIGVKSVAMPSGFPMEMVRWPKKVWLTNEKLFAVEAGLGMMGYNRLLLHPKFGASVILGTILIEGECSEYNKPIDYNPCIECGLCIKVCPTGAVKKNNDFNFASCYSHNYRERLGGFTNWVEQIVESKNISDYRQRVTDSESLSMWQNLSIGSQTRCDRCMAICPAGSEAIGEYLTDKKTFIKKNVNKFTKHSETIYAVKGSDAEQHVKARFPHKSVKLISNGLRPLSAEMFLESLSGIFQPNQSEGLDAVFHFSFTGAENLEGTVTIKNKMIEVMDGIQGKSDLHLTADSETWIKFLTKETSLLKSLITRRIKIKGSPVLMKKFAACFPG